MQPFDVAVFVGSLRRESTNLKLAHILARSAPPSLALRIVDLSALPMYNGDLEANRPEPVNRFTAECERADAFLFVMPEFNRSLPAVLKNAIDWGSKPMERNVWRDKPTAITGTSPGAIGTAVGQQHLRQILGILGASVVGGEAYLPFSGDLFDTDGDFAKQATQEFMATYLQRFAAFTGKLVPR
jgi:chromate reductase